MPRFDCAARVGVGDRNGNGDAMKTNLIAALAAVVTGLSIVALFMLASETTRDETNHEDTVIAASVSWLVSIGWDADMAESVAREFIREYRNSSATGEDE